MKKVILLLIVAIYCMACNSPKVLVTDDLVSVKLPDASKKLSSADRARLKDKSQFVNNRLVRIIQELGPGSSDVYLANRVYIKINVVKVNVKSNYLAELKRSDDVKFRKDAGYKSTIKTVKGNHLLIYRHLEKNIAEYSLFTFAKVTGLSCVLIFDIADEDQAKMYLETILNSIKFKQQV